MWLGGTSASRTRRQIVPARRRAVRRSGRARRRARSSPWPRKPSTTAFCRARDQRPEVEVVERRPDPERVVARAHRRDHPVVDRRAGPGSATPPNRSARRSGCPAPPASAAPASRSASSKTSCGDLPPSSSVTGTTFAAAAAWISRPTGSEPVNERWSIPGCAASAAPASSPSPGTTLSAPAGSPASPASRGEGQRGQARLLGRLQHAGVAGGERGDHRAADHLHRIVPRDDVPGDAVRLAQGVDGVAGEIGDRLARSACRPRRRRTPDSAPASARPPGPAPSGLPTSLRLETRQLLEALLDQPSEPREHPPALRGRSPGPSRRLGRRGPRRRRRRSRPRRRGRCAANSRAVGRVDRRQRRRRPSPDASRRPIRQVPSPHADISSTGAAAISSRV